MSEIKIFYKEKEKIKVARSISALKELDKKDIIWIDLLDVSDKTEDTLEGFLKIDIQEDEEMEEIELSSRYIQTDDSIVANSNFLKNNFEMEPVNFILKNGILVSIRDNELDSFNETFKKVFVNTRNFPTGYHVLVALFETRVEKDADLIEDTTDMITELSQQINAESDHVDEDMLVQIKDLQEKVTIIRQNIMDKQRRLDYLQDTFLGLVNIEQNKIIKIFTVINIIFLPPTLIGSLYGMNFDFMPELHWQYGYVWALGLMIFSVVLILLIFKLKKWL